MGTAIGVWTAQRSVVTFQTDLRLGRRKMEPEILAKLEELLAEQHHLIRFTDRGWTIAHPLRERLEGTLFDCRISWDNDSDPGLRGLYWLEENVNGPVTIGMPYEGSESAE